MEPRKLAGTFWLLLQPSAVCWFPCFLFDFAIILLKTQWISFWDGLRWVLESQLSDIQAMHTTLKICIHRSRFCPKVPIPAEVCGRRKKCKETKSKVEEFLEGHKHIQRWKKDSSSETTSEHYTVFFFPEQIPPPWRYGKKKKVLETMCPHIDAENV